MAERGVTLKKAGELLGGDEPWSVRTVSRKIACGDLEAYGERRLRRVTMRSIDSYERGERGIWRNDAKDERPAPAPRVVKRMAPGRRGIQSAAVATTSAVVSIPARMPKRGVIR